MIVFSWTSIAFASFEFFFTILASLSIFSIVVTCIFYVGKRELYFNLCNSSNDNALQWVLVSYDLLLLYQILRLTSNNCNHMRLITNQLALLNNIWKRKKWFYMLHVECFQLNQKWRTSLYTQKPVLQYSDRFLWVKNKPNALPIYRLFFLGPSHHAKFQSNLMKNVWDIQRRHTNWHSKL